MREGRPELRWIGAWWSVPARPAATAPTPTLAASRTALDRLAEAPAPAREDLVALEDAPLRLVRLNGSE